MSKINPHLHDEQRIQQVLISANILRIAYLDAGKPALVPVNFGYQNGRLYFHSSKTSSKLRYFRENPQVSFQTDCGVQLINESLPCKATVHYQSVMGSGLVSFIEDEEQKHQALLIILRQHGIQSEEIPAASIRNTEVLCIEISECTYKQSPVIAE
jgi:nitroimidazol reductase NimA-like FMN-containing flavoprotein (pyridoxamine 5'-phosphate oxidase superfamily)